VVFRVEETLSLKTWMASIADEVSMVASNFVDRKVSDKALLRQFSAEAEATGLKSNPRVASGAIILTSVLLHRRMNSLLR
jgi:hypothetical protein